MLTDKDGVPFETDGILGLPANVKDDGGGGGPISSFGFTLPPVSTLTILSLFPSKSGDKGNE